MKNLSLGWPLAIASAGTLISLATGAKGAHVVFGTAWAGLSALHAYQYRKKLCSDVNGSKIFNENGVLNFMAKNFDFIPKSKLDLFIRSVEIASYMPGRVRLYSNSLVGNETLKAQVEDALRGYEELKQVTVSTTTGSILIEYVPDALRKNEELARAERYIECHAKKILGR